MARKRFDVEARISVKDEASKNVKKIQTSFKSLASSIKRNALSIVAALATVVVGFRKIEQAAERLAQKRAFERALEAQGIAADEFLKKLQNVSDAQIASADLILATNRSLALGIQAADIPGLLETSAKASVKLGISVTTAFNDITTGVGRASPLILDNLGIVVDAVKVYDAWAGTLGKTSLELTKLEKTQALTAAVIATGASDTKDFADQQEALTRAINKTKTEIRNWVDALVEGISKQKELTDAIGDVTTNISNFVGGLQEIGRAINAIIPLQEIVLGTANRLLSILKAILFPLGIITEKIRALGINTRALSEANVEAIRLEEELAKRLDATLGPLLKNDGATRAWALAMEQAGKEAAELVEKQNLLTAASKKSATAMDELGKAIGIVTSAELAAEIVEIQTKLESARAATGGLTDEFLRAEEISGQAIDNLKLRMESLKDGAGDLATEVDDAAISFDGFTTSLGDTNIEIDSQIAKLNQQREALGLVQIAVLNLTQAQERRLRLTGQTAPGGRQLGISDGGFGPLLDNVPSGGTFTVLG